MKILGLQLKKPEIISILKHKNDITSNSQSFNGKYTTQIN